MSSLGFSMKKTVRILSNLRQFFTQHHFTQGGVGLTLLVAQGVFLAQVLYYDDGGHLLHHTRKITLHPAKPQETTCKYAKYQSKRQQIPWPIDQVFSACYSPSETIDYANHRIQCVQEAPLFRHDTAAESDRGHIEPKLHKKRHYITKIAILYIESRYPETSPKRK